MTHKREELTVRVLELNLMRSLIFVALVLVSFEVSAKTSGVPSWLFNPPVTKDRVYGVGFSGPGCDRDVALKIARVRARQLLSLA